MKFRFHKRQSLYNCVNYYESTCSKLVCLSSLRGEIILFVLLSSPAQPASLGYFTLVQRQEQRARLLSIYTLS